MYGIVLIIFIIYVITILSLRRIKTINEKYKSIIRKSVHLATGLVLFLLTFIIEKQTILILISAGTIFSFITYRIKNFNFIHITSGNSFGTLFYPVGLFISFLLLYDMPISYFQLTLMILSVSDTIANIGGVIKTGNKRFTIFKEEKSILGVTGFAISAFILHLIFLPGSFAGVYSYITLSVIAAVNFEIISFRGSDNLTIPMGCSIFFLYTPMMNENLYFPIIIIPVLAAGLVLLCKKNILTRYGSIAAYFLGVYLFAVLGTEWSIPVITFFLTSVIFTKINSSVNQKPKEANRRNIWQVTANILFAVISSAGYIITKNEIFIYLYITLIATVTADTWASEVGPVFSRRCFSISDFKFRDSGISGGVSLPGTIAALAGAVLISLLSYYLFFNEFDFALTAIMAISAFAAMFIDSLLSAFLEPELIKTDFFKNRTGEDSLSPNDIVNLLASFTAPVFFILFRIIMI